MNIGWFGTESWIGDATRNQPNNNADTVRWKAAGDSDPKSPRKELQFAFELFL